MGYIKRQLKEKDSYNEMLEGLDFKYDTSPKGDIKGYVRTFLHACDIERLWVTVSVAENMVYLYNEWECGGVLWEAEADIPQGVLNSEDAFINWLDSIVY